MNRTLGRESVTRGCLTIAPRNAPSYTFAEGQEEKPIDGDTPRPLTRGGNPHLDSPELDFRDRLMLTILQVDPQALWVVGGRHADLCGVALCRDLDLVRSGADIPRRHSVFALDVAQADGRADGVAVLA